MSSSGTGEDRQKRRQHCDPATAAGPPCRHHSRRPKPRIITRLHGDAYETLATFGRRASVLGRVAPQAGTTPKPG